MAIILIVSVPFALIDEYWRIKAVDKSGVSKWFEQWRWAKFVARATHFFQFGVAIQLSLGFALGSTNFVQLGLEPCRWDAVENKFKLELYLEFFTLGLVSIDAFTQVLLMKVFHTETHNTHPRIQFAMCTMNILTAIIGVCTVLLYFIYVAPSNFGLPGILFLVQVPIFIWFVVFYARVFTMLPPHKFKPHANAQAKISCFADRSMGVRSPITGTR